MLRLHRALRLAPVAMLLLLARSCGVGSAWAADAEPVVEITRDGTIDGTIVVGAAPDVVRSFVADVGRMRRLSKDVVSVEVKKQGECSIVTTVASNLIDVEYVARRCPTPEGWIETLLESDRFSDYYAEWIVRPVTNGIEIRFRLRTDLDMPLPSRLVLGALKKSVFHSMAAMLDILGGPHAPPARLAEP